ncbi:MAG: hypothetical protein ACI9LE_001464 [Paraglaciecola sp.]
MFCSFFEKATKSLDMDNKLAEVSAYVVSIPAFDLLPDTLLDKLVREISLRYLRVDEHLSPNASIQDTAIKMTEFFGG